MTSCVRNIRTKNYQNQTIGFKVTVKNVGCGVSSHRKMSGMLFETQCSILLLLPNVLSLTAAKLKRKLLAL